MKYRGEEARAIDGKEYTEAYVEVFTRCFGQHPYDVAMDSLARQGYLEAIGLFEWLLRRWPTTCLEGVDRGGQLTSYFWGGFPGGDIAGAFKTIGKAPADFAPILRRLEAAGVFWIIQRGGDILELELRVPEEAPPREG